MIGALSQVCDLPVTRRVDDARIYTLPVEPPEIFMSGFGPKSTDVAARIADGYISTAPEAELVTRFKDASGGKPAMAGAKVAMPTPLRRVSTTRTGCGATPGCPAGWPRCFPRRGTSSRPPRW